MGVYIQEADVHVFFLSICHSCKCGVNIAKHFGLNPNDVAQPLLFFCVPVLTTALTISKFSQRKNSKIRGRLKRSARAVQLFGRLAVLETHTLRY